MRGVKGALPGTTVLVTQPGQGGSALAQMLREWGARVIDAPAIVLRDGEDAALDQALRRLADYDWIVLSSPHGADRAAQRAKAIGIPWPAKPRIAAVGSATRRRLEGHGLAVAYTPAEFRSEALAHGLPTEPGARVLLLRARDGDPALAAILGRRAAVDDVHVYSTQPDPRLRQVLASIREEVHWITFASASAVAAFDAQVPVPVPPCLAGARIACIGPVTAKAAREAGHVVHAEANPHTAEGLASAILEACLHG